MEEAEQTWVLEDKAFSIPDELSMVRRFSTGYSVGTDVFDPFSYLPIAPQC